MSNLSGFGKPALDEHQRRNDERHDCRIPCRISLKDGECYCTVINISLNGAGLKTDVTNPLRIGSSITFSSGPLNGVSGIVRWASPPRFGIQFHERPATRAAITAAFNMIG